MSSPINLLLVGVSKTVEDYSIAEVRPTSIRHLRTADEFVAFVEKNESDGVSIAIAGPLIEGIGVDEIAQALRGASANAPIYFCHESMERGYDRSDFKKNGFSDAFLFPVERAALKASIEVDLAESREEKVFRSVRVVDIAEDTALDFDLFVLLWANKKYIRYAAAGQPIGPARLGRLNSHAAGSAFVSLDDMPKFYAHSAAKLREVTSGKSGMSETEKREKAQLVVRDLVSGMYTTVGNSTFEDGKQILEDANEIVKAYLSQSTHGNIYDRIAANLGASGSYSHLTNVSTFAALFSMATGVGNPEDLALAGLFHDIGVSMVPPDVQAKPEADWSKDERAQYQRHPEYSVNLLKAKRVVVPTIVQTMILQHHERNDGAGYPLGLRAPQLKTESQVLGLADEFDELTKPEIGKPRVNPLQALAIIKNRGGFDLDLVNKIEGAFEVKAA